MIDGKREIDALALEGAELWLRLRDHPADPEIAAEARRWRALSPDHERIFAAAGEIWNVAGQRTRTSAPAAWMRRRPGRRRPAAKRWAAAIGAAAAACLAVMVAPTLALMWQADHRTGTGARATFALNDGSSVTLDADSALAIDMTPDRRGVKLLAGRAWFDVAHDTKRPFRVAAGEAEVTVTGTEFEVGISDVAIDLGLAEGGVRAAWGPREHRVMGPGERLHITRATRSATRSVAIPAAMGSWRRGRLALENARLGEAVDTLGRYHSGMIVFADSGLRDRRITGVFDAGRPEQALRLMVGELGGSVHQITPWMLIISSGS